jgi:hypothetical protein
MNDHHPLSALLAASLLAFAAGTASAASLDGLGASSPIVATQGAALAVAKTTPPLSLSRTVLGVVNANGGAFDGQRLTLTGVQPFVTWFTDRPMRRAGLYDIPGLIEGFFAGQAPPNAAIEVIGADASRDVAILELSAPQYSPRTRRLVFAAKRIPVDEASGFSIKHPVLGDFAARNDAALPKRLGKVVMFVDSAPCVASTDWQKIVQFFEQRLDQYWTHIFDSHLMFSVGGECDPIYKRLWEDLHAISIYQIGPLATLVKQVANGGEPDIALFRQTEHFVNWASDEWAYFFGLDNSCTPRGE